MQNLKGKTLILVGGAGYIGSHVCKAVHDAGGIPVTVDNFSSGHEHAVQWGPSETIDLRDRAAILAACQKYSGAYAVIHLASSIEVGIGEKHPAEFYTNNVVGALNLLDAMKEVGLDKLIFSSTCATYGETDQMPLLESQVQKPFSVYGKTKLAIEHMIQSYHKAYDLKYITLRYFNASGADASGQIGEEHDPETHLIPLALAAAAGLRAKMKIFGTDYDTPDGTCIRDYIHVTDIAAAHIRGLEAFENGLEATELNIGTGKGVSNLEILKMIEKVTGMPVEFDATDRRDGDLTQLYADSNRAKDILNFTPKHSNLENIIKTAWTFHKRIWDIG